VESGRHSLRMRFTQTSGRLVASKIYRRGYGGYFGSNKLPTSGHTINHQKTKSKRASESFDSLLTDREVATVAV